MDSFPKNQLFVFCDINNHGGTISIGGGAEVTFYDDITQNGSLVVPAVGSQTSAAVSMGSFSGDGGFGAGGDVLEATKVEATKMSGTFFLSRWHQSL